MFAWTLCTLLMPATHDCTDGSCDTAAPRRVEWRYHPDEADRAYLFVDGIQVGGLERNRLEWRDFDAARVTWSPALPLFSSGDRRLSPPIDGPVLNFGVQPDPDATRAHGHYVNGKLVEQNEIADLLANLDLRDDSSRLRLTVIGPETERRQVMDDLANHPALAEWKSRTHVQSYPPDHWTIAGKGFVTTGRPTIYIQSSAGQVLHRQDEYRGPQPLAEALRRADPNYRPDRDPDLNRQRNFTMDWRKVPTWGWIVAGLSLLYLLRRRNAS